MGTTVELAGRIAACLGRIEGVTAVALGGSWARGDAHADSDIDLGIYYHPNCRPSVEALRFPDAAFDVVLNRHAPVYVEEIVRVLRSDGVFITQQVGRRNTQNILAAFGWRPESHGEGWWQEMPTLVEQFQQNGCAIIARAEYDVRYRFRDIESLVFWLKSVPLREDFNIEKHWRQVAQIITEYRKPKGIETNEHRELLIVQKR